MLADVLRMDSLISKGAGALVAYLLASYFFTSTSLSSLYAFAANHSRPTAASATSTNSSPTSRGNASTGSANLRVITDCPNRTPESVRGGELLIDPIIEYPHTHKGECVGYATA